MPTPDRTITPIDSLDDPRIADYRNVKDTELARSGDRFIAESDLVVRRLLASDYPAQSVLVAADRAAEIAPLVPPAVPLYAAAPQVVSAIIGFRFHSGVIACGRRKPPVALDDLAARWSARTTLLVLPETTSPANLGSLLRIAAAFGVDAVLLGPSSCDPFFRQSIRISMGTIFRLGLLRSTDLAADLRRLRSRWGVQLAAAVLAPDAEPLASASRPDRLALLFGNEAQGLRPDHVALADRRLTIPMQLGTDSLNVAVSAAIFLFHFTSH
jgi:tRNA G18 (ribose-2'-O)-methylase SpoU